MVFTNLDRIMKKFALGTWWKTNILTIVAERKGRKVRNLCFDSHKISCIQSCSGVSSVFDEIRQPCLNLVHSCVKSEFKVISFVANPGIYVRRIYPPIGRNVIFYHCQYKLYLKAWVGKKICSRIHIKILPASFYTVLRPDIHVCAIDVIAIII